MQYLLNKNNFEFGSASLAKLRFEYEYLFTFQVCTMIRFLTMKIIKIGPNEIN